jgi:hypothetical protein
MRFRNTLRKRLLLIFLPGFLFFNLQQFLFAETATFIAAPLTGEAVNTFIFSALLSALGHEDHSQVVRQFLEGHTLPLTLLF